MTARAAHVRFVAVLVACLSVALMLGAPPFVGTASAEEGRIVQVKNFGSNPGGSNMYIYVPKGVRPNATLIVQPNPLLYAATCCDDEFGWIDLANRWKNLIVVFDEHLKEGQEGQYACGVDSDRANSRGGTEATSTLQMVNWAKSRHSIDRRKVFLAGLSCGGIWSGYMAVDYPEVFAGAGIVAGYPFRCANGGGPTCIVPVDRTPQQWGDLARTQNPGYRGPWPKISSWQGVTDPLIPFVWQQEVVDQWTNLHGIDQVPETTEEVPNASGEPFTRRTYNAPNGPRIETWLHPSMRHRFPVNPGTGPTNCGKTGSTPDLTYPSLCATYYMAKFWGITPQPAPRRPAAGQPSGNPGSGVGGSPSSPAADRQLPVTGSPLPRAALAVPVLVLLAFGARRRRHLG